MPKRPKVDFDALVRRVVTSRSPDAESLLEPMKRGTPLTDDEREAIREIILDEFLQNGLLPDDEPNQHGLLMEDAIDWLGTR